MQQIVIKGSSQLQNAITQLTNYNSQFQSKVNELCSEQKRLDTMWDGASNDEFNRNFNKDKKQFDEFHKAIQDYATGLKKIKENYERAEAQSKQIAASRS